MKRIAAAGLAAFMAAACARDAAQESAAIDPAALSRHVKALASDAFEGRGPGTEGERKTIDYLARAFAAAGAEPGGENGGWTQAVKMYRYAITSPIDLAVEAGPGDCAFALGADDAVVWTRNAAPTVAIDAATLLFLGYGVDAPAKDWSDYAGVDVKGKVVIVLANDPDHQQESGPFEGPAMTYYGRLPYKVDEASLKGAAAVLIVNHQEASGYRWPQLQAAYSAPALGIETAGAPQVAFAAWLKQEAAEKIFACAGLDLAEQRQAAQQRGFRGRMLAGATLSARFDVSPEATLTHNVVAILEGARRPEESFVYTAHWDHLGVGKPDSTGDTIYNGALDNAGGTAGLIELARVFAAGPRPERSIIFIAMTLEESGLLGSEYYASHPLYPLETTAGGINMDAVNLFGETGTMEVTGLGRTTLEDLLEAELERQGRVMQNDPNEVVGFYYRSDHFPFVKRGVPFLFAGSGWDLAAEKAPNTRDPEIGTRFHQPSDEWLPELDFEAAARDMRLYHAVGLQVANSKDWPQWRGDKAEFASLRAKSDAARR